MLERRRIAPAAVVILILILAFALRSWRMSYQEVEGDEAFSYIFSMGTPEDIVNTTIANGEPHPVGSYFLDHYWLQLAGHSEFAFRFPSLWFGVLAIAVTYRLSRRLRLGAKGLRTVTPILATLLMALSPFLVQEARNARMYSMNLSLSVVSTWLAVELIESPAGSGGLARSGLAGVLRRWFPVEAVGLLATYALTSWIALNMHYFSGTILVAQNVFVLVVLLIRPLRTQWHVLARWVIAELLILAAFAPWYLAVRSVLGTYAGVGSNAPSPWWVAQRMASVFALGEQAMGKPYYDAVGLAALALIVLGTLRLGVAGRQQRLGALLMLLIIAVPCTISWYDARSRTTFTERYLLGTAPGYYALMAAGVSFSMSELSRSIRVWLPRVAPAALGAALAAGMVFGLQGYYAAVFSIPNSWRPFRQLIKRYSANVTREQLRVAQNYPEPGLTFYYDVWPWAFTLPSKAYDLQGATQAVHDLAASGVERVILRLGPLTWWNGEPAQNIAKQSLATEYSEVYEKFTGRWTIAVYSRANLNDLKPSGISFENGVMLKAALTRGLSDMRVTTPEKYLEVYLSWKGDPAKLKGTEKLFIHVLDPNGQLPAQLDVPLTAQDLQVPVRTYSVPIADSVPPGAYPVRIGLYDPGQPGAPRLRTSDQSDGILIDTLTIEP